MWENYPHPPYPPLSEEEVEAKERYEDDKGDHLCDIMLERDGEKE